MSKRLTGLQSYQSSTPFVLYNSAIFQILQIYKTASLFSPLSGKMKITNLYQEGKEEIDAFQYCWLMFLCFDFISFGEADRFVLVRDRIN